jgi:hypothetical protein
VQSKKRLVSRSVNERVQGFIRVLLCSYESEKWKASFNQGRADLTVLLEAVCSLSWDRVNCCAGYFWSTHQSPTPDDLKQIPHARERRDDC